MPVVQLASRVCAPRVPWTVTYEAKMLLFVKIAGVTHREPKDMIGTLEIRSLAEEGMRYVHVPGQKRLVVALKNFD